MNNQNIYIKRPFYMKQEWNIKNIVLNFAELCCFLTDDGCIRWKIGNGILPFEKLECVDLNTIDYLTDDLIKCLLTEAIMNNAKTEAELCIENPILPKGYLQFSKDIESIKIGDGSTPYNSLPFVAVDLFNKTSEVFKHD